jgi:hypothetical protein
LRLRRDARARPASSGPLQARAQELARSQWLGGPTESFERDGRAQLVKLLRAGVSPGSVVVEMGCGALRGGYWLIHFLDADRYHGIEPNREMVDGAREALLEPGLEAEKRPRFAYNDDFDLGVFDVAPDFVLARSIWSHTSKQQIRQLLDSFVRVASPTGLLLASYHRASGLPWGRKDYLGEAWVGRGPDSTDQGRRAVVAHRFGWIAAQCRTRALAVRETRSDGFGGQVWLEVTRV